MSRKEYIEAVEQAYELYNEEVQKAKEKRDKQIYLARTLLRKKGVER